VIWENNNNNIEKIICYIFIFFIFKTFSPLPLPWSPQQKPNSCLQVAAAHAVVFLFFYVGWPHNAKNSWTRALRFLEAGWIGRHQRRANVYTHTHTHANAYISYAVLPPYDGRTWVKNGRKKASREFFVYLYSVCVCADKLRDRDAQRRTEREKYL